ncbi:MAG: hypothetical protein HOC23_22670, partial [Halieaceae bacterium]|nr:hypothetical protein [Halieaceae bacterium]
MQMYPRAIFKLVLPLVFVVVAFGGRTYLADLTAESRIILTNLPYLICVVAVFMAYQFSFCRLLLAAVGISALYWLVQNRLQISLSDPVAARSYLSAALSLPLLAFYLMWIPERGIWNIHGLFSAAGFALIIVACIELASRLLDSSDAVSAAFTAWPAEGYVMSYGATLLTMIVVLAGVLMLYFRNSDAQSALVGCVVALYLALAFL